jgi:hypothetical protein
MSNNLDDLDGARGDPQPAKGRGLVIVDLGHLTIMPPRWSERRAAALASRPLIRRDCCFWGYRSRVSAPQWSGRIFLAGETTGCCGAEHC